MAQKRPAPRSPILLLATLLVPTFFLAACGEAPEPRTADSGEASEPAASGPEPVPAPVPTPVAPDEAEPTARVALYGADHVHTNLSFDAFTNGTVTTPADAYRWARGEVIQGDKFGAQFQIRSPWTFTRCRTTRK